MSDQKQRGLDISRANARSISDPFVEPDLAWVARFKLPLSWAGSKNSTYGRAATRDQRPFLKKAARDYRDAIALLARQAVKGVDVKHAKLWIEIFVEKTQQRGDAVNFVDLVCDAIKLAVPIDDRWYSIRRIDWAINKEDPHLFIGLAQEVDAVDSRACSYCGSIRPMTDFTNDRNNKKGKGHICITCRAPTVNKGPNKKYREPVCQ